MAKVIKKKNPVHDCEKAKARVINANESIVGFVSLRWPVEICRLIRTHVLFIALKVACRRTHVNEEFVEDDDILT